MNAPSWFTGTVAAVSLALTASGLSAQPAAGAPPVTDETVKAAIERATKFLWSQQNKDGHWEPQLDAEWARQRLDPERPTVEGLNRGGLTALALLGLVHGGADPSDRRFVRAVKWLAEQPYEGTYMRGLRAALWASLCKDRAYLRPLTLDANLLKNGIWAHGTYGYSPRPADNLAPTPVGDFSNTQYGVLGVWAGSEAGVEIPAKYWLLVQHGYLWGQQLDGGWRYTNVLGADSDTSVTGWPMLALKSHFDL